MYGGLTKSDMSLLVRHRDQRALLVLDDLDVVQRVDRIVGVADHVVEQHHAGERVRVEILELDARQVDLTTTKAARDIVVVFEEQRVVRGDCFIRFRVDGTSRGRAGRGSCAA